MFCTFLLWFRLLCLSSVSFVCGRCLCVCMPCIGMLVFGVLQWFWSMMKLMFGLFVYVSGLDEFGY